MRWAPGITNPCNTDLGKLILQGIKYPITARDESRAHAECAGVAAARQYLHGSLSTAPVNPLTLEGCRPSRRRSRPRRKRRHMVPAATAEQDHRNDGCHVQAEGPTKRGVRQRARGGRHSRRLMCTHVMVTCATAGPFCVVKARAHSGRSTAYTP